MKTANYLEQAIKGWYTDAKIDYDVNGKFINAEKHGNNLYIYHEENGKMYRVTVLYPETYSNEDIYNIWMETEWEEIE